MFTGKNTILFLPPIVSNGEESFTLSEGIQEFLLKDEEGNTYQKIIHPRWSACIWIKGYITGKYELLFTLPLDLKLGYALLEFCEQISDYEGKARPPSNVDNWWEGMECEKKLNPNDLNRIREGARLLKSG